MKVSEQFKSTIKAYLDNMAAVDSLCLLQSIKNLQRI